jgi:hypothetical protein
MTYIETQEKATLGNVAQERTYDNQILTPASEQFNISMFSSEFSKECDLVGPMTWRKFANTLCKHEFEPLEIFEGEGATKKNEAAEKKLKSGKAWTPANIPLKAAREGYPSTHWAVLPIDIDENAPTIDVLAAELGLNGWESVIVTTASHRHDGVTNKYRLVIKPDRPIEVAHVKKIVSHVSAWLGITYDEQAIDNIHA